MMKETIDRSVLTILSPKRRIIQHRIRPQHLIQPPSITGVSVIDISIITHEEDTQSRQLRASFLAILLFTILIIVLPRRYFTIQRNMKIVIEIRAKRTIPRKRPAHALLERLNLLKRPTGDSNELRVAEFQVLQIGDVIGEERTCRTASFSVRPEHEVVDNELFLTLEQVGQCGWARGAAEVVSFGHFDHGEVTQLGGDGVVCSSLGFFLDEERFAG